MFGDLVVGYLFLGGAGAGACVITALLALFSPAEETTAYRSMPSGRARVRVLYPPTCYRRLIAPGFAAAAVSLGLGAVFLAADLGRSAQVQLLLQFPTATFVSFGAFSLGAAILLASVLAVAWGIETAHWHVAIVRILELFALVAGCAVATYTGLLLSSMPAVPLWATPWLPALFVASSLSCGYAVIAGIACFSGAVRSFETVLRRLVRIDLLFIAIELACAVGFVLAGLRNPYAVATAGAESLVIGSYAALFVGLFGVGGLVLPAVLEGACLIRARSVSKIGLIASACVLAGALAMRVCIVSVGSHPEVWAVIG